MVYTNIATVRLAVGIDDTTISDADVTVLISQADKETDQLMNTTFEPKLVIDFLDNYTNNSSIIYTNKYPIIKVQSVSIDSVSVSPIYVKVYSGSRLMLLNTGEVTEWNDTKPQSNVIKYYYADMEESTTSSTSNGATVVNATTINVQTGEGTSFTALDYIKIYGVDGFSEIVQITNITNDTLTVTPALTCTHITNSTLVKMQVPVIIQRLSTIITGLMMVARFIGQSYTNVVGYDIDGLHVQKGEAYTQWRETSNQLRTEYKAILQAKRPKPSVA